MCIIAFSIDNHPRYRLIVAANRDEFYERPTAYAHYWMEHPNVLGGKDLTGGGTWLAVDKRGRMAALTNFRDLKNIDPNAESRGNLTKDFLISTHMDARGYLQEVSEKAHDFNGFNLLLFDKGKMFHFANYENEVNTVSRGAYGLSNALLNTPWPKVERLKRDFREVIKHPFNHEDLMDILANETLAEDGELPSTGVPYEWEKALSAVFIKTETYGTCCSTVITIDHDHYLRFTEKSFPVGNRVNKTKRFSFQVEA